MNKFHRNFIWIPILISFLYQIQKGSLDFFNSFNLLSIVTTFFFIFFRNQKLIKPTILTMILFITIFVRLKIGLENPYHLFSFIFFLLSLVGGKRFILFSIGSLILTPQFSPLIIFHLINGNTISNQNKRFQIILNIIFVNIFIYFTITQTGLFSEFYKNIFDSFFKPMNLLFLIGIISLTQPYQLITKLIMALFLTSFCIKGFIIAPPTPNIFFALIISILFAEFLTVYPKNIKTNNLFLFTWLLFGALF